ncbi:MAG TPA: hypothetical protein EYM53_03180 [Gammaproteobacteria bacterium]|nr:hypothetical protein [Gammaproteobacteria bacterium]
MNCIFFQRKQYWDLYCRNCQL